MARAGLNRGPGEVDLPEHQDETTSVHAAHARSAGVSRRLP
jgi:hypothetical protein